jgi:predicted porin
MSHTLKTGLLGAIIALGLTIPALAADKNAVVSVGGNCCSDLEERIAELEATTAKKGNRKVRLTVSGSVNQSLLYVNVDGKTDQRITNNSTTGTFINFAGSAQFSKEMYAGFVIELGQSEMGPIVSDALSANPSTDVDLRRAAVWIKAPIGKLTLGKDSDATDGVAETSITNTHPATRLLSFRPLLGGDGITENADLFDGQRLDGVRYDSPAVGGFTVSASWSAAGTANALDDTSDVYAVALRYYEDWKEFKVAGAVGYRKGAVFPGLSPLLNVGQAAFDQETLSGSASVLHATSGLFLNVAAGQTEIMGAAKIKAWEVMPGIETRLNALGKTTFFAEYAVFKLDGADEDLTYYGGGVVQAIDAAALSLYVSGRQIDVDDESVWYALAGMKLDF